MDKKLQGSKLAGGNPEHGRVEYDFYATNPKAVDMLLDKHEFGKNIKTILEPCVGQGHIIDAVKKHYTDTYITVLDIVNRGYPDTIIQDFITWKTDNKYDLIITNPPFSLGSEFVRKGMTLLSENGQMAMFLKIQFLEGSKRKELFDKYPPKYIYVFRNRMATWNNGQEKDPNTGKNWATTMCHAWFIWENGFNGEPIVRWL